jgi:hypothetical protein
VANSVHQFLEPRACVGEHISGVAQIVKLDHGQTGRMQTWPLHPGPEVRVPQRLSGCSGEDQTVGTGCHEADRACEWLA